MLEGRHEPVEEVTTLKALAITITLLLLSTGLARPFVGAFASGNYITNTEADPLVVSLGAQAGVHNLLGLLGARGTVELSVYPDFALAGSFTDRTNYHLTEVAGDALFSTGLIGVTGYTGSAAELGGSSTLERCRLGRSPELRWPGSLRKRYQPSGCKPARAPCSLICGRGQGTTSVSRRTIPK
jgi:hypothetical protein